MIGWQRSTLATHGFRTLDSFERTKPSGIVGKVVPHYDRDIENEIRLPEEGRQMHRTHTDATVRIVTGWYRTLVRRVPGTLLLGKYYLHLIVNVRIL